MFICKTLKTCSCRALFVCIVLIILHLYFMFKETTKAKIQKRITNIHETQNKNQNCTGLVAGYLSKVLFLFS